MWIWCHYTQTQREREREHLVLVNKRMSDNLESEAFFFFFVALSNVWHFLDAAQAHPPTCLGHRCFPASISWDFVSYKSRLNIMMKYQMRVCPSSLNYKMSDDPFMIWVILFNRNKSDPINWMVHHEYSDPITMVISCKSNQMVGLNHGWTDMSFKWYPRKHDGMNYTS